LAFFFVQFARLHGTALHAPAELMQRWAAALALLLLSAPPQCERSSGVLGAPAFDSAGRARIAASASGAASVDFIGG